MPLLQGSPPFYSFEVLKTGIFMVSAFIVNVNKNHMTITTCEIPSSVVVLCFFRRFDSLFVNYNH